MANTKKAKSNGRLHKIKDQAYELAVAGIGEMSDEMSSEEMATYCLEVATYLVDYEEPEED